MEKWKENKLKYTAEYKKTKLKRIPLEMSVESYEELKEHAANNSESVNGFIKRAILETMERDNAK